MLCASFPFAAFFLRPILNTTEDSIMHHTPTFFHHLSRKSLLAAAAVIFACLPVAVRATPPAAEKLLLWSGQAPVGDGKSEAANVSISVYRVAGKTDAAAMVICPGGGYGGLVVGAGRARDCAMVEPAWDRGDSAGIPASQGPGLRAAAGCAAGHPHGPLQRQSVGHRPGPHRHHRLLGGRAPGLHGGHPLRPWRSHRRPIRSIA